MCLLFPDSCLLLLIDLNIHLILLHLGSLPINKSRQSFVIVAASTTVGIPIAITGTPNVSFDNSFLFVSDSCSWHYSRI